MECCSLERRNNKKKTVKYVNIYNLRNMNQKKSTIMTKKNKTIGHF